MVNSTYFLLLLDQFFSNRDSLSLSQSAACDLRLMCGEMSNNLFILALIEFEMSVIGRVFLKDS